MELGRFESVEGGSKCPGQNGRDGTVLVIKRRTRADLAQGRSEMREPDDNFPVNVRIPK